jgi:hypothetical protein
VPLENRIHAHGRKGEVPSYRSHAVSHVYLEYASRKIELLCGAYHLRTCHILDEALYLGYLSFRKEHMLFSFYTHLVYEPKRDPGLRQTRQGA